jgi:hypothetical protein
VTEFDLLQGRRLAKASLGRGRVTGSSGLFRSFEGSTDRAWVRHVY